MVNKTNYDCTNEGIAFSEKTFRKFASQSGKERLTRYVFYKRSYCLET